MTRSPHLDRAWRVIDRLASRIEPLLLRRHRAFFWCLTILVGFLEIWAHRYFVNPDGVSYIELAWAGLRHGPMGFVNGYWSPLYPVLLSAAFRVFHPSMEWESTVVHLTNFAIYLASLACFELFLGELLRLREASPASPGALRAVPSETLWNWGYIFFIWAGYIWLNPALVTPDILLAALAYLAMWALLRIRNGRGWAAYALLGAILGVGYLAKEAMFPLAWVFLLSSVLVARPLRRALPRAVLALAVFLAISAPLLVALSTVKHRPTFGDSGRDNYAWFVDRVPDGWWQGGTPRAGTPAHPIRKILAQPAMYEFAAPVGGSFPPTYDPSYWYEGVRPYFSLTGELTALFHAANFYLQMFTRTGALYAMFLLLYFLLRREGKWRSGEKGRWKLWLPLWAALGMYALIHVEPRFLGEFVLMLLMAMLAAVRIPMRRMAMPRVALAMIVVPAVAIAWSVVANSARIVSPDPPEDLPVAQGLVAMGVPRGAEVGFIGDGAGSYWAHLAGLRIVADLPDEKTFWAADAAARARILGKFAAAGAGAVVTCPPNPSDANQSAPRPATHPANQTATHAATQTTNEDWQQIADTDYYILRLAPAESSTPPAGESSNRERDAVTRRESGSRQ